MADLLNSIVLGVVEGVTEFLPISSTGHLVLCEHWMGINLDDGFWKTFSVFIQIGAICAVLVYFWDRIMKLLSRGNAPAEGMTPLEAARGNVEESSAPVIATPRGLKLSPVMTILIATVPVLIIGLLINDWVDKNLGSPTVVALALGIGGVLMIAIEFLRPATTITRIEDMTLLQGVCIGLSQVLAILFPGTSRSAATIMAGLIGGLSREAAAEYSFFLAIPVMFAACGYKLLKWMNELRKIHEHPTLQQILLLSVGTLVSFLVAWLVIAMFMNFIRRHSFVPFGIYRVGLCLIVLLANAHG